MRSFVVMSITALLLMVMPARADLRVCNSLPTTVRLALVWINPADVKPQPAGAATQNLPFTTQGWWSTDPGKCTNIDADMVLMYYRLEGGKYNIGRLDMPFFAEPQPTAGQESKFQKFRVQTGSFRDSPGSAPAGAERYFAKFSAFPLRGKGQPWLQVILDISNVGVVTAKCTVTAAGGGSISAKC